MPSLTKTSQNQELGHICMLCFHISSHDLIQKNNSFMTHDIITVNECKRLCFVLNAVM